MSALTRFQDRALPDSERIRAAAEVAHQLATERPHAEAWRALCKVLHDDTESVRVRKAAIQAMARAPSSAVNQLTRVYYDPERLVRKEAVRTLRSIGFVGNEEELKQDLAKAQRGTVTTLANLAMTAGYDPRIVKAYRQALAHPDPTVRHLALMGLAQLGEMADVLSGLKDPVANIRVAAAEYVGVYGLLEEAEVRALEAALHDSEPRVARSAKAALKRLGAVATNRPGVAGKPTEVNASEAQWHALLSSLSQVALQDLHYAATLDDEVVESGWLGFPGASDADIAQLSARLGASLPPSYESFLRLTNGFRRISPFIAEVFPANKVRRFSDDHSDWIDVYMKGARSVGDKEHRRYGAAQDYSIFDVRYLSTAIQISEVGDGVLLLNPAVTTSDGEWEAWFFANWLPGAERSPSFFELIQTITRDR